MMLQLKKRTIVIIFRVLHVIILRPLGAQHTITHTLYRPQKQHLVQDHKVQLRLVQLLFPSPLKQILLVTTVYVLQLITWFRIYLAKVKW